MLHYFNRFLVVPVVATFFLTLGFASGSFAAVELALNLSAEQSVPGDQPLAELIVSNSGSSVESSLSLRLQYPAGLLDFSEGTVEGPLDRDASCNTIGGNNGNCESGEFLIWDIGNLAPGQVIRSGLRLPTSSSNAEGTTIDVSPSVTADGSTVATATRTITITAQAAMSLAIDEDNDPVQAGSELEYTLSFSNFAGSSVTGAELAFDLPANTTFIAASGGGTEVGNQVIWDLGSVPAGSAGQRTVQVEVSGTAVSGELVESELSVSGMQNSLPTSQQVSETAHVGVGSDLTLSMTVSPNPSNPGTPFLVEMNVTNSGSSVAFGGRVQLRIPSGVVSLTEATVEGPLDSSASCGSIGGNNSNCESGEFMIWTLGNVAPGRSARLSFSTFISSNTTPGTLSQWEVVLSDDGLNPSTESVTQIVQSAEALRLAIEEDKDPVAPGENLTYTLHYGNFAGSSATSNILVFRLPPDSTFVSATDGGVLSGRQVTWDLPSIPNGRVGQVRVVTAISSTAAPGQLLEARLEINGTQNFLPISQRISESAYVGTGSLLDLKLSVAPAPGAPGTRVFSEMIVSNPGSSVVFGGQVRLRYPIGLSEITEGTIEGPLDGDASCGTIGGNNGNCEEREFVVWSLGNLAPGQSIRMSLNPFVASNQVPGLIREWELVVTDDSGGLTTVSRALPIQAIGGLFVSIDESADPVSAGENVGYRLNYGNHSGENLSDTILRFTLPEGTNLVSTSAGGVLIGNVVQWPLNSLPSGSIGNQSVVLSSSASAAAGTLLESELELSGLQNSQPLSRYTTETLYVGEGSPLSISLNVRPDPALPGTQVLVDMSVTNPTDAVVFAGSVFLRYPTIFFDISESTVEGPLDTSASCGTIGGNNGNCEGNENLVWDLGDVGLLTTIQLSFPATVGNNVPNGVGSTVEAILSDDTAAQTTVAQTLQVGETPPGGPIVSSILPVSRSVQVGEVATAFASVINAGNDPAIGCSIAPITPLAAEFRYQATDSVTNGLVGTADTPVDIIGGGTQTFAFFITPTSEVAPTEVALSFDCANTEPAPVFSGLNTLLFSADSNSIPDVIGLTTTADLQTSSNQAGENQTSLFAVGSSNVGATGNITVSVDDGEQGLPLQLSVCLTSDGACVGSPAPNVTLNYQGTAAEAFAIFVTATGVIPNNPAVNRIFVRFTDDSGVVRGATSTAVRTQN